MKFQVHACQKFAKYKLHCHLARAGRAQSSVIHVQLTLGLAIHAGEPDFIERMEHKYHQQAQTNGCLMASAAGFDSAIADLGVLHAINQLQSPAVPSAIESFLTVHPGPKGAKG